MFLKDLHAPKLSINDSIIYMQNNIFYTYYSIRTDSGWSAPAKLLSSNQHMHYFQRTNLNNSFASSYYEGSPTDGNISKVIVVNPGYYLTKFRNSFK